MSVHSHLSEDLYHLITKISNSKSREDEYHIVLEEIAKMKTEVNLNKSIRELKEELIRGLYFEILGYSADMVYIPAINLSQSKHIPLKKLGYMTSSLFINEKDEISILIISSMQKDLVSKDDDSVIAALNCFCQMGFDLMAQALYVSILKLTDHKNLLIRKKSLVAILKMRQISPRFKFNIIDIVKRGLRDKSLGISSVSLTLLKHEMTTNSDGVETDFSEFIEILVDLLSRILNHVHQNKDYDFHRIPAPWTQIAILKLLSILCYNDSEKSELVYDVVLNCLNRNTSTGTNIGNSVSFQAIYTISQLYPCESLLDKACLAINSFLMSDNSNLKYLGIKGLMPLVQKNQGYAIEHQLIILDCLESLDVTIKRETLKFLFSMTNISNIEAIATTLLRFLKSEENSQFKENLISKILEISEKYAPSQSWFLETMRDLFFIGHDWISPKVFNSYLSVVEDIYRGSPESGQYLIDLSLGIVKDTKTKVNPLSIKMVAWVIGEIGPIIYEEEPKKIEELIFVLNRFLDDSWDNEAVNYVISSFLKCKTSLEGAESLFSYEKLNGSSNQMIFDYSLSTMRFGNYGNGLMNSSSVDPDCNLKFLDSWVESKIAEGSKPYNNARKAPYNRQLEEHIESQLRLESYEISKPSLQNQNQSSKEIQIDNKAPKLWTAEGYINKAQPPKIEKEKIVETINKLPFNTENSQSNFLLNQNLRLEEKKKAAGRLFGNLGSNNLFDGLKFKPKQIEGRISSIEEKENKLVFEPISMSLLEYEALWDVLKNEKIIQLPTIINSVSGYSAFLNRCGFRSIEIIDNEIISASSVKVLENQYEKQDLEDERPKVLLYGKIGDDGNLELRMKSEVEERLEEFTASIVFILSKYFKKI